jgi:hypothetical protein
MLKCMSNYTLLVHIDDGITFNGVTYYSMIFIYTCNSIDIMSHRKKNYLKHIFLLSHNPMNIYLTIYFLVIKPGVVFHWLMCIFNNTTTTYIFFGPQTTNVAL